MPSAAPRFCSCGRYTIPAGQSCPCYIKRKAASDAARPSASARGYDVEWVKARSKQLARFPTCVSCGGKATLVDHEQSIRKAPERRLDPTNFQSMCATCHGKKTAKHDGSFGRH